MIYILPNIVNSFSAAFITTYGTTSLQTLWFGLQSIYAPYTRIIFMISLRVEDRLIVIHKPTMFLVHCLHSAHHNVTKWYTGVQPDSSLQYCLGPIYDNIVSFDHRRGRSGISARRVQATGGVMLSDTNATNQKLNKSYLIFFVCFSSRNWRHIKMVLLRVPWTE